LPGCRGFGGNETADQLACKDCLHTFIGPERVAKQAFGEWCTESAKNTGVHSRTEHAKCFLLEPSARRTGELFKVNRNQVRNVTGLNGWD
jgi:hypothetical protein